ncbi:response regulator [Candidatus Methylopumilus turicensis]|uniref:Response regulator receiver protein n=1 Tax=Candidatus Methylopumilus turicensis TaxID=1581680 RepID=A0A0B7IWZ6_9PROT|nr:response regulator [Candidatus Methylopumilus turicensis]CEN55592.1 Response regulator receiver protein [Candidatus Methylopumilus turicensis]
MKNSTSNSADALPEFYSTREAAEKLGLSLGTVQKMVETGALSAWKTAGGHRRVIASSVTSYMTARESNIRAVRNQQLSILVVEDDTEIQKLYALNVAEWDLNVDLKLVGDGLTALLHIAKHYPDLVIADLRMKGLDGFEMIHTLHNDSSFDEIDIVVVTGMHKDEIAARGGLPKGMTVLTKPISFSTLEGYVKAKEAARARLQ